MKQLAILFVLLPLSVHGQTLSHVQKFCEVGGQTVNTQGLNSATHVQRSFPSCTVTVYISGTTSKPPIYSDNLATPTVLADPFTANVDGSFGFWATQGFCYDVVTSGGNTGDQFPSPFTYANLCLGTGGGGGSSNLNCPAALNGSIVAMTDATDASCDPHIGTDFQGDLFGQSWQSLGTTNGFLGLTGGLSDPLGCPQTPPTPCLGLANTFYWLSPLTVSTPFAVRPPNTVGTVGQTPVIASQSTINGYTVDVLDWQNGYGGNANFGALSTPGKINGIVFSGNTGATTPPGGISTVDVASSISDDTQSKAAALSVGLTLPFSTGTGHVPGSGGFYSTATFEALVPSTSTPTPNGVVVSGMYSRTDNFGPGDLDTLQSVFGTVHNQGAGTIYTQFAGQLWSYLDGPGNITNNYGLYAYADNANATGVITNNYVVRIDRQYYTNHISHNYGLYIADQTTGGVNSPDPWALYIEAGKVNLGTSRTTLSSLSTANNCAVNSVSPAACGSAASGAFVVPTTTTTYTVNTTAVTAASRIFLMPTTDASNLPSAPTCVAPVAGAVVQSARVAATSFTFTLPSTTGTTCFNYWIVN